jgi:hypothetical protein
VLWQQFERVSVTWPDDSEVAAVERGDPYRALSFGERDHGYVRSAQPQVSVSADKVLDALPVCGGGVGHFQLALDDGRVEAPAVIVAVTRRPAVARGIR